MQQKQVTWLFVLITIGILVIGVFTMLALGLLQPRLSVLQPREYEVIVTDISSTPAPDSSFLSNDKAVPASPTPTTPAYSSRAVTILVNDTPVFSLSGKDVAIRLLEDYLNFCASENLSDSEHLIRAYIDAKISLSSVDSTVDYLNYEEAKERLIATRTIIPVVRSVERAEITVKEIETVTAKQPSLPKGSRFFRSLGKPEHLFGLSETIYKSGIAVSSSQTLAQTRVGSDPVPITIEEGNYYYTEGGENPFGKKADNLSFTAPCRGTILKGFGLNEGIMHYGIDYALRAGDSLVAPENGTVIFIGERGDYGLVIEIKHGNGFVSRLTHCASPSVELEQHVFRGDPIAVLAKQEEESQPHLHYELLIDGIPFDPLNYFE